MWDVLLTTFPFLGRHVPKQDILFFFFLVQMWFFKSVMWWMWWLCFHLFSKEAVLHSVPLLAALAKHAAPSGKTVN